MARLRRTAVALAVVALIAAPRTITTAASAALSNSTTFVNDRLSGGNLTFSLTATDDNGAVDLFLHFSAPAAYQWAAVGVGAQMQNSLMFVVYHDSSGDNVTFSPRTASGETEPSYLSSHNCSVYANDGTPGVGILEQDGIGAPLYSVNAHCRDVKSAVPALSLDLDSKSQPFIFAIGPRDRDLYSTSPKAGIRRHQYYGSFTMDMTMATEDDAAVAGTAFGTQTQGASMLGRLRRDSGGKGSGTHAAFMCGTFLVVFPFGVILLRVLERIKWHAAAQTAGLLVVCAGVSLGIWLSKFYNKSKKFNSAHQVIGMIVFALLFVQFGLGWLHHRAYLRYRSPTAMGRMHRYLGPLVVGAGLANGFVGFQFANAGRNNVVYLLSIVVMFVILTGSVWYKRKKDQGKAATGHSGPRPLTGPPPPYSRRAPPVSGYAESQASRSDIELGDMGYRGQNTRDLYHEQPAQPRVMV